MKSRKNSTFFMLLNSTNLYLNKYEIALDKVENLGYFVEIEVKHYTKEIGEEYDNLIKLAKDLGLNLNAIDKRGYPYYLIEMKYKKSLNSNEN